MPHMPGIPKMFQQPFRVHSVLQLSLMLVVAAVIERNQKILIGQRRRNGNHPLKWEFPGGKVEPGEDPKDALERELKEELAIEATIGEELDRYDVQYGDGPSNPPDLLPSDDLRRRTSKPELRTNPMGIEIEPNQLRLPFRRRTVPQKTRVAHALPRAASRLSRNLRVRRWFRRLQGSDENRSHARLRVESTNVLSALACLSSSILTSLSRVEGFCRPRRSLHGPSAARLDAHSPHQIHRSRHGNRRDHRQHQPSLPRHLAIKLPPAGITRQSVVIRNRAALRTLLGHN